MEIAVTIAARLEAPVNPRKAVEVTREQTCRTYGSVGRADGGSTSKAFKVQANIPK